MRFLLIPLLLSLALPATAQVDDDYAFETRALLAALEAADEAANDFEAALNPDSTAAVAPGAARRLRQRAHEGALEAARADLMMEMAAGLRAEAGAEAPISQEEVELRGLLRTLQSYGDDLVEVEGCEEGEPPLNFANIGGAAQPTLDRIRELTAGFRAGIEGAGE